MVWRAAGYLAPALVGAIVLGAVLPTLSLPGFGFGSGPGSGPLQLADPTLDLRRNLNQPDDRVVLEYQSDTRAGSTCGWRRCPSSMPRGGATC